MFITRALCAVIVAAALIIPASAGHAAPPDRPSLQGLVLVGGCPEQGSDLKNLAVAPKTPFLFAPLRLLDPDATPTGKWLMPYTIQVTGPGLKSRHWTPDEVYTRPGWAPRNQVICVFEGKTEDGPFTLQISGPIRGR
ncbi:MAG: hypothetical protein M9886_04100 [Candidatus Nanopelagicales bacterium]|nr:hypothetical protein [Candidatus Nanopelagicales bacterium]